MLHDMLLPNRFRRIGWFILVPATIAGIVLTATGYEAEWIKGQFPVIWTEEFPGGTRFMTMVYGNMTNTIVAMVFLVGALLVAFSREKVEDEYIREIRLSSLMWAVWVNYALLLFAILFIYGLSFLNVMIYNMFTILIIFIIRYHYLLYRTQKMAGHEK
jgi:hypothetical protein